MLRYFSTLGSHTSASRCLINRTARTIACPCWLINKPVAVGRAAPLTTFVTALLTSIVERNWREGGRWSQINGRVGLKRKWLELIWRKLCACRSRINQTVGTRTIIAFAVWENLRSFLPPISSWILSAFNKRGRFCSAGTKCSE